MKHGVVAIKKVPLRDDGGNADDSGKVDGDVFNKREEEKRRKR